MFTLGTLHLGLIYALLALGVYLTFRILNIPDLTVDGSFTLGLAVSAMCAIAGHPILGLIAGMLCGAAAGCITGFLQTKAGIHPILSGILTMTGLYTVNLFIMGGNPNPSLLGQPTVFAGLQELFDGVDRDVLRLLLILLIVLLCMGGLTWFFKTRLGLCIRATGNNEEMVRASSINTDAMKVIAVAVANGMVSLAGALLAQYQGYADINFGSGIIVIGLASVIIGETVLRKRTLFFGLFSAALGAVIYQFLIALALQSSFFSAYMLKLISAVIVAITLSIPAIQRSLAQYRTRKEGLRRARHR